jgi:hypothetical protein
MFLDEDIHDSPDALLIAQSWPVIIARSFILSMHSNSAYELPVTVGISNHGDAIKALADSCWEFFEKFATEVRLKIWQVSGHHRDY